MCVWQDKRRMLGHVCGGRDEVLVSVCVDRGPIWRERWVCVYVHVCRD